MESSIKVYRFHLVFCVVESFEKNKDELNDWYNKFYDKINSSFRLNNGARIIIIPDCDCNYNDEGGMIEYYEIMYIVDRNSINTMNIMRMADLIDLAISSLKNIFLTGSYNDFRYLLNEQSAEIQYLKTVLIGSFSNDNLLSIIDYNKRFKSNSMSTLIKV